MVFPPEPAEPGPAPPPKPIPVPPPSPIALPEPNEVPPSESKELPVPLLVGVPPIPEYPELYEELLGLGEDMDIAVLYPEDERDVEDEYMDGEGAGREGVRLVGARYDIQCLSCQLYSSGRRPSSSSREKESEESAESSLVVIHNNNNNALSRSMPLPDRQRSGSEKTSGMAWENIIASPERRPGPGNPVPGYTAAPKSTTRSRLWFGMNLVTRFWYQLESFFRK